MEVSNNSNTSDEGITGGLMELSKEAVSEIFDQINAEKEDNMINFQLNESPVQNQIQTPHIQSSHIQAPQLSVQPRPQIQSSHIQTPQLSVQSRPQAQSRPQIKQVNIQTVPEIISIPSNKLKQGDNLQGILKQTKSNELIKSNELNELVKSNELNEPNEPNELNELAESTDLTESAEPTQNSLAIDPQYFKIMNFEISKLTLYFAAGLVLLIAGYYYMQYKSKKEKEEKEERVRRGKNIDRNIDKHIDRYEE